MKSVQTIFSMGEEITCYSSGRWMVTKDLRVNRGRLFRKRAYFGAHQLGGHSRRGWNVIDKREGSEAMMSMRARNPREQSCYKRSSAVQDGACRRLIEPSKVDNEWGNRRSPFLTLSVSPPATSHHVFGKPTCGCIMHTPTTASWLNLLSNHLRTVPKAGENPTIEWQSHRIDLSITYISMEVRQ